MKKLFLFLFLFPSLAFSATSTSTKTATGSWICPPGVTAVQVVIRAPGGGSGGMTTNSFGQGAGAGGQYVIKNAYAVTAGTTYTVTIGAIGAAGSSTGPTAGTAGGDTWFSSNDANGVVGKGGAPSTGNSGTGASGSTTGGVGDTVYAGGNGGSGGASNAGGGGGEGGRSGATGGNGGNGSGATPGAAGTGGDGGDGGIGAALGVGTVGANYGGGGGGSGTWNSTANRNGIGGGTGNMVLTWTTPATSALTDNFNDNSIDTAKWTNSAGGNLVETNQQLEQTSVISGANTGLGSLDVYDLTGSQATIKVVDAGDQSLLNMNFLPLTISTSPTAASNYNYWSIWRNVIYARNTTDGSIASAAYVAATFRYLKIRESSGTTYFDYSSDGINWNNLGSIANQFTMTAIYVFPIWIYSTSDTGTTTVKTDDFNILPSAGNPGAFFQMWE